VKPEMRRAFWVFLATTFAGLLIFAIGAYQIFRFPDRSAGPSRGNMQITIPRGATAQDVSTILEDAGLITRRIDGTRRPCRLAKEGLASMERWLEMLRKALEANYDRLDSVLAEMAPQEGKEKS